MFFFHKLQSACRTAVTVLIIESMSRKILFKPLLVCLLMTPPALSNDRDALYGQWGTLRQCSAELIVDDGSKKAAPFILSADWLSHGEVWCRLRWQHSDSTVEFTEATARAVCGEDSVRDYHVEMLLANDLLTLIWDRWLVNGPLRRCE